MASKKELKKIINAIAFDVVDECFYQLDNASGDTEKVLTLLNDAINFRNEAIIAVNAARRSENPAKAIKAVAESLENTTFDFIERLNKLA